MYYYYTVYNYKIRNQQRQNDRYLILMSPTTLWFTFSFGLSKSRALRKPQAAVLSETTVPF